MNITVPHSTPQSKRHYTYTLAYPDNFPDAHKAGTVFYVGKGRNTRIYNHEYEARKGVKSYKCNVIRLIWASNCKVDKNILAYFDTHEDACMHEIALIFFMDGLANLTYGGDGANGYIVPLDARRKMSEARKGKIVSEETKRNMSNALKGHVVSEATRRKISEANKGKVRAEDVRRNMSNAQKNKILPEATRRKIGEASKGNQRAKGYVHTEATRRKISKGNQHPKAYPRSEEHRRKISENATRRYAKRREQEKRTKESCS